MKIPYNWLKEYVECDLPAKEVANMLTLIGHALDKPIFERTGDEVMDLEDRGNRADVMGVIGIARDLAVVTNKNLKLPKIAEIPPTDNKKFKTKITVFSDKILRWRVVTFKNVKIEPSPKWMQERLFAYGIDPKNNMVDITNYVMLEYGMPLHAFDLDKVDEINLRNAKKGETLITFEGTELKLDENDLVAADSKKPLTLTTAIGGRESGISDNTKNVLIEAGLYHQPTVRKSALKHNVRNDTSRRLEYNLHPEYCELAIARTIQLVKDILKVDPENVSFDYYPNKKAASVIELTQERLDLIAGEYIPLERAKEILEKLNFKVDGEVENKLKLTVPYFRTDVTMEDDVIEEVLRIKGYNTIPMYLPYAPAPKKLTFPEMDMENMFKDTAAKLGFNEVIGLQISDIEELKKAGIVSDNANEKNNLEFTEAQIVKLENSWNKELNILRPELFTSLLKYYISYQKHEIENIKLFECGKTYTLDPKKEGYEKYIEHRKIGCIANCSFMELKGYIEKVLEDVSIEALTYKAEDYKILKTNISSTIFINNEMLGVIGELKQKLLNDFSVQGESTISYLEIDTTKLSTLHNVTKTKNRASVKTTIKSYVSEDVTFNIGEKTEVSKIMEKLKAELSPITLVTFKDIYIDDKLKKDQKKAVTFNFKFDTQDQKSTKDESEKIRKLKNSF